MDLPLPQPPSTARVPEDYATIRAALHAGVRCVQLAAGRYTEDIVVSCGDLAIIGTLGVPPPGPGPIKRRNTRPSEAATVVDGHVDISGGALRLATVTVARTVRATGNGSLVLEGCTIQGCTHSGPPVPAVRVSGNAAFTAEKCKIWGEKWSMVARGAATVRMMSVESEQIRFAGQSSGLLREMDIQATPLLSVAVLVEDDATPTFESSYIEGEVKCSGSVSPVFRRVEVEAVADFMVDTAAKAASCSAILVTDTASPRFEDCEIHGTISTGPTSRASFVECRIRGVSPLPDEHEAPSPPPPVASASTQLPRELVACTTALDALVGLSNVKEVMRELAALVAYDSLREAHGVKVDRPMLHALFLGNPGTGKTTVAKQMGKMFADMGALRTGHVVRRDRASLIGTHIGWSEEKIEKAVHEAIGGVLFIDEAYSLATREGSWDFGQKVIDILVERMDERRGEFVVVAAGYPRKMKEFLQANPGLRSRFGFEFTFHDYTPPELLQILYAELTKWSLVLDDEATSECERAVAQAYKSRGEDFGNGRLMRTWAERVRRKVATRVWGLPEEQRLKAAMSPVTGQDVRAALADDDHAA